MAAGKPDTVRRGQVSGSPEAAFFQRLLDKEVSVTFVPGYTTEAGTRGERGILLWVDKYTIGIRLASGIEVLVYKHAISEVAKTTRT